MRIRKIPLTTDEVTSILYQDKVSIRRPLWTQSGTRTPWGSIKVGDFLVVKEDHLALPLPRHLGFPEGYDIMFSDHDDFDLCDPAENSNSTLSLGWERVAAHYMPEERSRLTLQVVDVRTELLHEITEIDARHEGVAPGFENQFGMIVSHPSYLNGFRKWWDSQDRFPDWERNPEVAVLTFHPFSENIQFLEKTYIEAHTP